jgi:hypothetical protein
MHRLIGRAGFLGLLGVCALILGSPRDVDAAAKGKTGVVANPPITVMPAPDPWIYDIHPQFVPYVNLASNPTVQEYFAPGDYFTITGFGNLIGIVSLSLTDFQLDFPNSTPTTLRFDYTGPASGLFTQLSIGSVEIDTDTLASSLVFNYFDHLLLGGTTSVPDNPIDNPNYGPNIEPVTLVPEPTSIALLALGMAGGLYFRRRAARRNA